MCEKHENREEDKDLKAPSKCKYFVCLLIITAILLGEGIVIISLMTKYKSTISETEMLNKKYEQSLTELEKIENIIDEMSVTATDISLEEYNKLNKEISSLRSELFEQDDSSLYRDITNTMQYQYDNFTGNLTIILTIIGSIIAILTIIFPLFNYAFLNKDQLDSMNKKVKKLIKSMDKKVDEKVTELNKKIDDNIEKLQKDVKEAKNSAEKAENAAKAASESAKNSGDSLENINKKYIEIEKQVQEVMESSRKVSEAEKRSKIFSLLSEAYNTKDYNKQIELYTEIIELDPKYAGAYNNRGIAYGKSMKYEKAIEDYTKAIDLDPKYKNAYYNRGIAYYEKGEYDKAIEDYTKAIDLDSKCKEAYNNRGIAYINKEEYDKAIEDFSKAIELDPKFVYAYNGRGLAYYEKGEYDEAKKDFDKAIEFDPEFSYAYGSLAEMYSTLNDTEEFYKYLEIALSKKYPLIEEIKEDEELKRLYDKYKDEKRFKDIMKKCNIDYPE